MIDIKFDNASAAHNFAEFLLELKGSKNAVQYEFHGDKTVKYLVNDDFSEYDIEIYNEKIDTFLSECD